MSSKNNVNPGQYKTRGSQRQGEDVIHDSQKKEFSQASSANQNQDETQNLMPVEQPTNAVKNKEKAHQKTAKSSNR